MITIKTPKTIATGSHSGDNTHHQDQSITLHNFNVINTMASKPQNPIPPPDTEEFLLINLFVNLIAEAARLELAHRITDSPR